MKIWTVAVFITYISTSVCNHGSKYSICKLKSKNTEATCSFSNYIPKLPPSVTILNLENNVFLNITGKTFQNISTNKISQLRFRKNNSIQSFAVGSFKQLVHLKKLHISNEKGIDKDSLKESFYGLNRSIIEDLRLEGNGWKSIPSNFFFHLNSFELSTVSLSGNKFMTLDAQFMRVFAKVESLLVENNEIVFVNASGLDCVHHLSLQSNNIFAIPNFCENTTKKTLVHRLKRLELSDNAIRELEPDSFRCLYNLEKLILDRNRIHTLENNIFWRLVNLKEISLGFNPSIKNIMPLAFNSSSLRSLRFVQNSYRFDKKHCKCQNIFKYTPYLEKLDLTKNYLPNKPESLYKMLCTLTKLTTLRLEATFITDLPDGLFQRMPYLQKLHLKGNRITRWNRSVFENLTSLQDLYMDGNYIRIINETSFPINLLLSLKKLDLSNNEYWCTCALKWFVDFLQSSNITTKILLNWPYRYACIYPEDKFRLELKEYRPTENMCSEWSPFYTIVILASASCFLVVFILLIMYRCHTNIRNLVYLFRVYNHKRRGYLRLHSSENFDFDTFIVYCDADRTWVHDVLLKRLENQDLKVCIHHRDFNIGTPITDNIEQNISKSWKVLVVMSNNFTKSEWCQWELDLVQERRRRHGKEAVVLIMYNQIDSSHMTSSITSLLDTTPHLKYKTGIGEDLFWSVVVKAIRKPLSNPPTSIL